MIPFLLLLLNNENNLHNLFFLLHRPPWMDLNNLYFFDANKIGEDKKPSKHLVISDVNEVKCFDSASA